MACLLTFHWPSFPGGFLYFHWAISPGNNKRRLRAGYGEYDLSRGVAHGVSLTVLDLYHTVYNLEDQEGYLFGR